jgi:hypothetical protein
MAEQDLARCRLRLTQPELTGVHAVRADPALPAWARELLDVVASPGLRTVVRIFTAGPPLVYSIWATPQDAVFGAPTGTGQIELATMEPALIPFTLAQLVGLRRRPAPPTRSPIRVAASTYLAAPDGAGVSPALAAIFRQRRTSWRAMAAWRDRAGDRVTRSLHVTDAGPAGLWQLRVEEPATIDPMLFIEPSNARDVWRAITDLLPTAGGKR